LTLDGGQRVLADSLIREYGANLFNIKRFEKDVAVRVPDVRDEQSMRQLVPDLGPDEDVLFDRAGETSHVDSITGPHDAGEVRWGKHSRRSVSVTALTSVPRTKCATGGAIAYTDSASATEYRSRRIR
jgi:hypothetical protein